MQSAGEARAVFVDPTGRRSRLVARACWALGVLLVAYVALVLVSLLLPPGLSRLTVPGLGAVLPGPAAAPLGAVRGGAPEVLLAPPTRPSPQPPSPSTTVAPRPTPPAARQPALPVAPPPPAPSPARTAPARPTAAATRAPTTAPGRPTAAPTRRATQAPAAPPGSTRTPKPRPSNTRGPR